MNVDLALELSKLVHDECKEVPHDIGIRLIRIVEKHQESINFTDSSSQLKDKHKTNFDDWVKENCKSLGSVLYLYKDRKCSYNALKIDYRHELEESL